MIHNVRETGKRLRVRPSDRLRVHFLSLARQLVSWQRSAGFPPGSGITIGVTSVESKSGRSVVALNLAASLASFGRGNVLFVETENSPGGFSRKIPKPGFGLSEMLVGESASVCICNTNVENLFVMPCGRARDMDAMELPIEALDSLNAELCNTFDYIIYDLPIANEMTLCFPMASHLDGVVIVNSPNIHEHRIHRVVRRIREMNKPALVGLVLNKA